MELVDVLKDFKKDLERAKHDMAIAKELIEMGEEMKLDIAKPRTGVREVESKMALFESVIDKRLSREKKE